VNSSGVQSRSVIQISDCRFLEADTRVDLEGRVQMSNCFSLVPIIIDGDDDAISVNGLIMDVEQYLIDATVPETEGFVVEDLLRGVVTNVSVDADGSGSTFTAVQLGANDTNEQCVFSNISVRHDLGDAISMNGAVSCTLVGFVCRTAVGAGTRLGLQHGFGSTRNVIGSGQFQGYDVDTAVDDAVSSQSHFHDIIVVQAGGAIEYGFVGTGTGVGNTYDNIQRKS